MNSSVAHKSMSSMMLLTGTIASFLLLTLPISSSFSTLSTSISPSLLNSNPSLRSPFLSFTAIGAASSSSESEPGDEKELQGNYRLLESGTRTTTMDRRTASMGLLFGGALLSFSPAASHADEPPSKGSNKFNLGAPPSLLDQVSALETANYVGQAGRPIYKPNVRGEPANNMPQVKFVNNGKDGINLEVSVNHVMTENDYVKFIWLKDVKSNDVVLVKGFPPNAPSPPTLKARVPNGVELRPYSFVSGEVEGLWKGESFVVPSS